MAGPSTTKEKMFTIAAFLGLQRESNTHLVKESDLLNSVNIQYHKPLGAMSKAPGYVQKGDAIGAAGTVLGHGALNTSAGTNKLIAVEGTSAWVWNSGTGAWDEQTGAGASFTASAKAEFESFLDHAFMVNKSDATRSYTGSAWSTTTNVTDAPKAAYIKLQDVRLYLAKINIAVGGDFLSRVWFSDLPENNAITWNFESGTDLVTTSSSAVISSTGAKFKTRNIKVGNPFFITTGSDIGEFVVASVDSETQITLTETLANSATGKSFWVGGNWFDVFTNDSDIIEGLGKWSSQLLVFKRDSLHRFDKSSASATPVKNVPGTTSHRSIIEIKDWTLYFHPSGFWRYDGTTSKLISTPLWDYVEGILAANYGSIVGWSSDNRIGKWYIGNITNNNVFPELSLNDAVYCYDTKTDMQWIETKEFVITATAKFIESSAINYYVSSNVGIVNQIDTGNAYNTSDMDMRSETHPYFIIAPEVKVPITRVKIYTKRALGLAIRYKLHYDVNGDVQEDYQTFASGEIKKNESELLLRPGTEASGISFEFIESGQSIGPIIERISIFYLPLQAKI